MADAIQDVGYRAKIEGYSTFMAQAKGITTQMNGVGAAATASAGQTTRAAGAMGTAFSTLKASVIGLGAGFAAAFGVQAVIGGITGAIGAASNLQESINKVDVVFGDAAEQVVAFSETTAQGLGQSRNEALAAIGVFGNLFTTMGLGQQDAADMAINLDKLASDLASFNNIDPAVVLEKLRAGLVGEAEPLRTLGINLSEAEVAQEALRMGLAKTEKELTNADKIQARYALIVKQSANAQGDFARTSTGMANSQRIIAASLADIQTEIGSGLLPLIAPLVSGFAQALPGAFKGLRDLWSQAGEAAGALGRQLQPLIDFAGGVAGAFGEFVQQVGPSLVSILQSLYGGWLDLQTSIYPVRLLFGDLTGASEPLQGALAVLRGLLRLIADGLKSAVGPAQQAGQAMRDMSKAIQDAMGALLQAAMPQLRELWAQMVQGWQEIAPLILPALQGMQQVIAVVLATVQQIIGNFVAMVREIWTAHGENIMGVVRNVWGAIGAIISGAISVAVSLVKGILKAFAGDWAGAWEEIKQVPIIVWNTILDATANILKALVRVVAIAVEALRLEDVWYGIRDFILKVWFDIVEGIKGKLNEAIQAVNDFIGPLNQLFAALGRAEIKIALPTFEKGTFATPPRESWEGWNDDVETWIDDRVAQLKIAQAEAQATGQDFDPFAWLRDFGTQDTTQQYVDDLNEVNAQLVNLQSTGAQAGAGISDGMRGATGTTAGLKREVQDATDALREAEAAMQRFSSPRLAGMQAFEDAMFDLEMAEKRARLAELGLGDAAESTNEGISDTFDVLEAQRREIEQGIPVAFQRAEWEAEQARRRAETADRGTNQAAEERDSDRLAAAREALQLQYDLQYEPQLRQLREMYETATGANEELTFEQALVGLQNSTVAAEELRRQVEEQTPELEAQQTAAETLDTTRGTMLTTEQQIKTTYDDQLATLLLQKKAYEEMIMLQASLPQRPIGTGNPPETPRTANPLTGLASGGTMLTGGAAMVGERGPELAVLPRGTTVLPHSAVQAATVSRNYSDTFNIYEQRSVYDVWHIVQRNLRFARLQGGRA